MSWPLQYGHYYQPAPYFPCTPRVMTPVIPDPMFYPRSPYSRPATPDRRGLVPTDPTTPNTPNLELPPWDGYRRERNLAWQGFNTNHCWPRRYPIGSGAYQAPDYWNGIANLYAPSVNPWIDAELPRAEFFLDLSLPTFEPMQLYGSGQSRRFPEEEYSKLATYPPFTHLKIVFNQFPQWPCHITRYPSEPPLTLGDVLGNIHIHVHIPITMSDFTVLEPRDQIYVAEAFTKRCQTIVDNYTEERAYGVKRVDYLLGKTRLIGLLYQGRENGWDVMKVVVTRIGT